MKQWEDIEQQKRKIDKLSRLTKHRTLMQVAFSNGFASTQRCTIMLHEAVIITKTNDRQSQRDQIY